MALAWWRRRKEHLGWKEQNTGRYRGTNEFGPSRARDIHLATELAFFPQFIRTPSPHFPLPSVPSFPQERYYHCKSWRDGVYPWQLSRRLQPCSLESPQGSTTPCFNSHLPLCPPPKGHPLLLSSSLLSWVLFFLLLLHFSIFL